MKNHVYVITLNSEFQPDIYLGVTRSLEAAEDKIKAGFTDLYIEDGHWYTNKDQVVEIRIYEEII